jgi:putative transposase
MVRLPRSVLPSYGVFHVTARGVDRCPIYLDDDDHAFFDVILHLDGLRAGWKCHAYCAMPNHFHAIVEAELKRVSWGFHRINGTYAQRFNERYGRVGHLFQSRFHAKVIGDDDHLGNACEYVWSNPVRSGLCAEARDWPWSGRFGLRAGVYG